MSKTLIPIVTLSLNRREMEKWKSMYVVFAVMSMILRREIQRAIFLQGFRLKSFPMNGYALSVVPIKMSFLPNNEKVEQLKGNGMNHL